MVQQVELLELQSVYTHHKEMMRYEIDQDNAVRIYEDGKDVPFVFQPDYPNGTPFEDAEAAAAWADKVIAHHSDPEKNEFPA